MAKNGKSAAVKRSIELASLGAFEEARKPMGKEFTEDVFLANITVSRYNTNLFNFVQEFKNPDWHVYVQSMNAKAAPDFIHLAAKHNIDLLKRNDDNQTILDVILANCNAVDKAVVLEAVDPNVIVKAFLDPEISAGVFKWLRDGIYYGRSHYDTVKEMPSIVDAILSKINTPEVLKSDNYKKLFEGQTGFVKELLNDISVGELSKIVNSYPEFFGNYGKVIMDTKLIKKLGSSSGIDREIEELFDKAIESKSFTPNLELMTDDWKGAVLNGRFNMRIDSKEYSVFKKLLANQLLSTEKYNNPDESSYTVFERFLYDNLNHANFRPHDIPKVMNIIEEAQKLSELGIEKKCAVRDVEGMNKMFEGAFDSYGRHGRFNIDKDVEELAWQMHIPPHFIQGLVDFLDKRYNYSPESNLKEDSEKDKMKKAWSDLMSQVTFTKEVEQEKKATVKP